MKSSKTNKKAEILILSQTAKIIIGIVLLLILIWIMTGGYSSIQNFLNKIF
jgi:hypothetical protein